MLLQLPTLFDKYNMNVRGVIQVGAHWCEEYDDYKRRGIKNMLFIEPSKEAMAVMEKKLTQDPDISPGVLLCRAACGDGTEGDEAVAFVEHNNQGQSSSLLRPKVHLTQHSNVVFDDREMWNIKTLDAIMADMMPTDLFNLLNMDVQGYEDRVLRGATETLKHIDYIYTEVNREEMYENCAMVDQLIAMLPDFKMVELGWASDFLGWGDALFIRKTLL